MKTRHHLIVLAAVVVGLFPSGAAQAKARPDLPQAAIVKLINRERVAAGLVPLRVDAAVSRVADRWSRQMASAGRLAHNEQYLSVASLKRLRGTRAGENVAVASSLEQIHRLFMQSAPHRGNVLQPDYRLVGVAAVRNPDGLLYVTEDFLRRG
jgi:uncharacterized protein YkwD